MSVFPHPHYRRVLLGVASTLAVGAAGLAAALPASASPAPPACTPAVLGGAGPGPARCTVDLLP